MKRYRKQRNYGCRVHDQFTYFQMKTVVLENDKVRVSILADKGTEIYEYLYKPLDLDYMWLSEHGVSRPNDYLATSTDPVSNFIDYYPGGWQEVFPNGGPTSGYMGTQFGQHGEIAHMPWDVDIVEDTPERVSVRFTVITKKVPFRVSKRLTIESGSPRLLIDEEIENLSDVPLQYMWGHHLAFGHPFLDAGCRIILPDGIRVLDDVLGGQQGFSRVSREPDLMWPIVQDNQGQTIDLSVLPPKGTPSDVLYLTGFKGTTRYRLENDRIGAGFEVEWDADVLPYLWYWQEFGKTHTYPWYGRHYNIGLEPFAGYPSAGLSEAVANGSAASIPSYGSQQFKMSTAPYPLGK